MKRIIIFVAILLVAVFIVFSSMIILHITRNDHSLSGKSSYGTPIKGARIVQLIDLIMNPDKYDGQHVSTIGVIRVDYNSIDTGPTIAISKDAYKYKLPKNGVAIELNCKKLRADILELKKFSGRYVKISGTFKAKAIGELYLSRGCIDDISYIEDEESIVYE